MDDGIIKISINEDSKELAFKSVEEVQTFFSSEIDSLKWTNDAEVNGALNNNLYNTIDSHTRNIPPLAAQLENDRNQAKANLLSAVSTAYGKKNIPLSTSPNGKFIEELKQTEGKITAAAALSLLMGMAVSSPHRLDVARGQFLLLAYLEKLSNKTSTAVSKSLSQQSEKQQTTLSEHISAIDRQKTEFENELAHGRSTYAKLLRRIVNHTRSRRNKNQKRIDAALLSIDATEKLYKEHMHLDAATIYWNKKSGEHRELAEKYRNILIGFSAIGSIILIAFFLCLISYTLDIADQKKPTPIYFILASAGVVFTTVMFWIARVLVRLFFSQQHLTIDSDERAVMAKTYLALAKDGLAGDKERAIVLSALFRPTADGIVKDDASPEFSPSSLLSKIDRQ